MDRPRWAAVNSGTLMTKWVYTFGDGTAEGSSQMHALLGGKGANLAEMANLGLPVPPGFTITTDVCAYFYANSKTYPAELKAQVDAALKQIETITGRTLGDAQRPLLVSVRSGSRASMPGMMDTVLNIGLNDETVEALAKDAGDARFAYDSYRRFIQMYSSIVLGVAHHYFEEAIEIFKEDHGFNLDTDLSAADWQKIISIFKTKIADLHGSPFPQEPRAQLWGAIAAVFGSWHNPRAKIFRQLHNIPESWGTAVNVQAMVFGNMGDTSATGVAFTRNPSTGAKELYGEFLINAQGEDVVAGVRTPQNITEAARIAAGSEQPSMETALPDVFHQFVAVAEKLERHYRDIQDVEFTVERGKLWMLQTRGAKRTAKAALRAAVEMAQEGLISEQEAVLRIEPGSLDQLLHPNVAPESERDVIAVGLPASPGAASGEIVFNAEEAEQLRSAGRKAILVRVETSPEDIHGMHAAQGILTTRGGMTSHAAVVARGMGKPCVSGVGALRIDSERGLLSAGPVTLRRGDIVTIDGTSGKVMRGAIEMRQPELSGEFGTIMQWADKLRRLRVRANAETAADAEAARRFGAEGIGLCRTEHMFFEAARIAAMREMILAEDEKGRRAALAKLLPFQRSDFAQLFEIMSGFPVTIRLLDPPLHEFLPHSAEEIAEVAKAAGVTPEHIRHRAEELQEFNPMLGFRGCRLAIAFPEIAEMQARAIFEGAVDAKRKTGHSPEPEIMVPLVAIKPELDAVKAIIDKTAEAVAAENGETIAYTVGTMIELPRAALKAGEIAETAEFFSFGTNDLTQTALGISRDDSGTFLGVYISKGLLARDPFATIDQQGVGELVEIAVERGRKARADIKLGICGEHGGDPASIGFFERAGLDYVSCSPFRVPIARLAAAQAAVGGLSASEDS
jgi:pyruvate, orthophosphate dikinase